MKKRIVSFLAVVTGILFPGPSVFHQCYRARTPAEFKAQQTRLYNDLANGESKLSGDDLARSIQHRMRLYLWFHSRGWGIDEGDEREPIFNDWRELFDYWFQD